MTRGPLIVLACLTSIGMCSGATRAEGAARGTDAATSAAQTQIRFATCAACHGASGQGLSALPDTPYLAGLPAAYLERQLRAMAQGARQGGAMAALARTLTVAERQAAAEHYSALPRPTAPVLHATSKPPPLGRRLAEHGRWSQGLPACVLCHGHGGVGVGSAFPALAGQPAAYLAAQLHAFQQQGARPAGPLGLMKAIAGKLSDADIRAVADYFSSLSPAVGRRSAP